MRLRSAVALALSSCLWLAVPGAAQTTPAAPRPSGIGEPPAQRPNVGVLPASVSPLEGSLDSVKPNDSVEVLTTGNVRFRGRFIDVSDTTLKVETARRSREIPAGEVIAVWRPPSRHLKRNLIIGSIVGVSLAGMAYAGQGDCHDPTSLCATDGPIVASDVLLLTGLGAGFGALTSALHPGHADPLYFANAGGGGVPGGGPLEGHVYPGEWLEVRRQNHGEVVKGHLASYDANTLTLFGEPAPRTIPIGTVEQVWTEKPSWWRLVVPVGLGAFYGTILGGVACGDSDNCIGAVAGSFAIFYGTTGAFMLHDARRHALLYDARSSGPSRQTIVMPTFRRGGAGVQCQVRF